MNFALHEAATKDGDRDLKSDGAFGSRTVDGQVASNADGGRQDTVGTTVA